MNLVCLFRIETLLSEDWEMRCRVILVLLLSAWSATSWGRAARNTSRFHSEDPAYSFALATANRFLHAWQMEDHETGIIMLTDSARQQTSPELLQSFFSPGVQAAYEIAHGRRTNSGEYVFPIVLFGLSVKSHPQHSTIVVTRVGKDDWAIGRLP